MYRYICALVGRPLGDGGAASLRAGPYWTVLDVQTICRPCRRLPASCNGSRPGQVPVHGASPLALEKRRVQPTGCGQEPLASAAARACACRRPGCKCDEMNLQLPSAHVCHLQLQSSTGTRINQVKSRSSIITRTCVATNNQHDTCINTRTAQQPARGGAGKKRRRQRHRPRLEASLCRWLSAPQDPPCDIQASRDPTSGPD